MTAQNGAGHDILIIDDEPDIRHLIRGILEDEGFKAREGANAEDCCAEIEKRPPDLVILDIWLQGSHKDGLEILEDIKAKSPHMPVVMISGHGTIETAVSAIKIGAYDFIEKPFKSDRLLLMIRRAMENASLKKENEILKRNMAAPIDLIGDSAVIENLRQVITKTSMTNSRVLLTGEPGTGKDIAARLIHTHSQRRSGPFLSVNCAMLEPERLEEELFGSSENTSATASSGLLEQAQGGTLVLDQISDMPMATQGKILKVLQDHKFVKSKTGHAIEVDVRIIATSNRSLEKEIRDRKFREDLFYRLNVVPIDMPPLRERMEDIPALANHFLSLQSPLCLHAESFSKNAIDALCAYSWPGNIRQLRNVVEWVTIMHGQIEEDEFDTVHLPPDLFKTGAQGLTEGQKTDPPRNDNKSYLSLPLREAREYFEREYLSQQIRRFDGNVSKTSQFIGMERSALHRKLKSLQILGQDENAQSSISSTSSKHKRA